MEQEMLGGKRPPATEKMNVELIFCNGAPKRDEVLLCLQQSLVSYRAATYAGLEKARELGASPDERKRRSEITDVSQQILAAFLRGLIENAEKPVKERLVAANEKIMELEEEVKKMSFKAANAEKKISSLRKRGAK